MLMDFNDSISSILISINKLSASYENGNLLIDYSLEDIRINSNQCLHNHFSDYDL